MVGISLQVGGICPGGDRRKVRPNLLSIVHPLTMRRVCSFIRNSVLFHRNLPKSIPCLRVSRNVPRSMILSLALPRASSRPYDLSPTLAAMRHSNRTGGERCLCRTATASRAPAHAVYGLYLDLDFQTRLCYSNTLRWDSVQSCDVLCGGRQGLICSR